MSAQASSTAGPLPPTGQILSAAKDETFFDKPFSVTESQRQVRDWELADASNHDAYAANTAIITTGDSLRNIHDAAEDERVSGGAMGAKARRESISKGLPWNAAREQSAELKSQSTETRRNADGIDVPLRGSGLSGVESAVERSSDGQISSETREILRRQQAGTSAMSAQYRDSMYLVPTDQRDMGMTVAGGDAHGVAGVEGEGRLGDNTTSRSSELGRGNSEELEERALEEHREREEKSQGGAGLFKRLFGRRQSTDEQQRDEAKQQVQRDRQLDRDAIDLEEQREGKNADPSLRSQQQAPRERSNLFPMGASNFVHGDEDLPASPMNAVMPVPQEQAAAEKSAEGSQRIVRPRRLAMGLLPPDASSGESRSLVSGAMPMVEHGRGKSGENGRHCGPHTMPMSGGIFNGENLSSLSSLLPITDHHVVRVARSKSPAPSKEEDPTGALTPMNELGLEGRNVEDDRGRSEVRRGATTPRALSPMGATTA